MIPFLRFCDTFAILSNEQGGEVLGFPAQKWRSHEKHQSGHMPYIILLEQVAKVNKFTMDNVSRVRKRLKSLRDNVRADKEKKKNESLLQVNSASFPYFGVFASISKHYLSAAHADYDMHQSLQHLHVNQ